MQVSAANDSDVFRYSQPGIQNCVHRTDSKRIVIAEHSIRSRIALEQYPHGLRSLLPAICINVRSADDKVLGIRKPMPQKGKFVAFQTAYTGAIFPSADMGDTAAS